MNPATFTIVQGREVYVYVRGRLVMKRWLDTGAACLFQVAPTATYWSGCSHRINDLRGTP